jgi:threonine/homoserine/homoserine lactone efflux protein
MRDADGMQFATPRERVAFVLGFGIVVVGLILIIAGAPVAGLIVALIGGLDLVWAIAKVQRRAPAVRDDQQEPPPR